MKTREKKGGKKRIERKDEEEDEVEGEDEGEKSREHGDVVERKTVKQTLELKVGSRRTK